MKIGDEVLVRGRVAAVHNDGGAVELVMDTGFGHPALIAVGEKVLPAAGEGAHGQPKAA